jgi:hypothetical protein
VIQHQHSRLSSLDAEVCCTVAVDEFFFNENVGLGMGGVDERDSDSNVFVDLIVGNVLDDGHEGVVDDASHEPNGILHRPVAIDGNYP